MKNLHSPYLNSASADHLSRLKLGKTLFKNQLHAIGISDENTCTTCIREYNIHTIEDYKHAMFECPAVQTITNFICNTFFPNKSIIFDINDILLAIDTKKNNAYKEDKGNTFTNLVWNLFQVYIIKCHTTATTPLPHIAITEIKSQINRVLKILPKSQLARVCETSPVLKQIFQDSTI